VKQLTQSDIIPTALSGHQQPLTKHTDTQTHCNTGTQYSHRSSYHTNYTVDMVHLDATKTSIFRPESTLLSWVMCSHLHFCWLSVNVLRDKPCIPVYWGRS